MYFLVNASPPKILDVMLCKCIGHMIYGILDNISCDLDPYGGQKSNTILSCKTVGCNNYKLCRYTDQILGNISSELDSKVKVKYCIWDHLVYLHETFEEYV